MAPCVEIIFILHVIHKHIILVFKITTAISSLKQYYSNILFPVNNLTKF